MQPRVALLKPLSSAISIGSGGPFGAEGPIIMTGGAVGSLIAQLFHLSASERKTLLVSGAAAGMSATFASPLAAVLLAVELLLFEWKPRSFIPTALASVTATAARRYLMGPGPLFPTTPHELIIGPMGLLGCVLTGVLAGAFSALLTGAVYASEDLFAKLPIHWMWWPMIGGLAIGVGGLIFPEALGVGYDMIGGMLQQSLPARMLAGILLVKSAMWAISLGSGTSGGVLAPLLMMGGALGAVLTPWLPAEGAGFWPMVGMGAILGGTMRSPFTGVVFMIELTHDVNMILPLLIAVLVAHGFTVLTLRRSILTEKVSRRGFHLDPAQTAIVEAPARALSPATNVSILNYQNDFYRIRCVAPGAALVRIALPYAPGWRAEVDRHSVDLVPVDEALTGVFVPAGEHEITLEFRSEWFRPGAILSGLGLVALLLCLVLPV